ncbi:hypothetical protein DENSPDRAFT_838030 [Dentipellis sp. KUC8613]|nr:hypothetical protein DENSPDRAFT_838030 [Dentipellis sp. KUC8613]
MAVFEFLLVLAFLIARFQGALASLYVINPSTTSVCHGGQPCTVDWLDDGELPLLSTIGACTVGLYTGNMQLVQQIEPVDVSAGHTLTFTPNPEAGPNSKAYYIAFTSTVFSNNSQPFQTFTPNFAIDQMKGSFESAVESLTSSIAIPSSVSKPPANPITTSTISVSQAPAPSSAPVSSHSQSSSALLSYSAPSTTGFSKVSTSSIVQPTSTSSISSNLSSASANSASAPSQSRQSALFYLALSSPFILSLFFP